MISLKAVKQSPFCHQMKNNFYVQAILALAFEIM
jgi:hypothetical protein